MTWDMTKVCSFLRLSMSASNYLVATWDTPPRPGEPGYSAFEKAFDRFIDSQTVFVPKQDKAYWKAFDDRNHDEYRKKHMLKEASDLELGQASNFKLMPFQVCIFDYTSPLS